MGYPSEEPCQPLENPVHPSSFTQNNPVLHLRQPLMTTYLDTLSMNEIILELKKWKEPTPPEEEVLNQIYMSMYKQYISGWGYLEPDQERG